MKDIKDFTVEELQEEIEQRKTIKQRKPTPLANPKVDEFLTSLTALVDLWTEHGKHYADQERVFGTLMSILYGNQFLNWYDDLPNRS